MIEAQGLVKRYGTKTAVDGLSFIAQPGQVTGFLGPNGAGKSTTMRMIMSLDRPDAGRVTVNGKPYDQHRTPLQEVGALLEARAVHTGRTAKNHLRAMATTAGIGNKRVDEVIELTGLGPVANKRAGQFSLGMGQRLGIASALLGDPETLIFDEPVNGLDPEGVLWVRNLVRHLAAEGRTIFMSSHLMSEMAQTADHVIVVGRGKLIASASIDDLVRGATITTVTVRSPHAPRLAELLAGPHITISSDEPSTLTIDGLTSDQIGEVAAANAVTLHELSTAKGSLEQAYMALTQDAVEFQSGTTHVDPAFAAVSQQGATR